MPSYLSGGSESLNVGSDSLNVGSFRGSYTLQIGAHTSGVSLTINNRIDKNILMISECLNQVIAKTILYSTRCGTVDELLGLSLHYQNHFDATSAYSARWLAVSRIRTHPPPLRHFEVAAIPSRSVGCSNTCIVDGTRRLMGTALTTPSFRLAIAAANRLASTFVISWSHDKRLRLGTSMVVVQS